MRAVEGSAVIRWVCRWAGILEKGARQGHTGEGEDHRVAGDPDCPPAQDADRRTDQTDQTHDAADGQPSAHRRERSPDEDQRRTEESHAEQEILMPRDVDGVEERRPLEAEEFPNPGTEAGSRRRATLSSTRCTVIVPAPP